MPKAPALDDLTAGDGNVPIPSLNTKSLATGLKGAAGPATGVPDANPQWPNQQTQEWLEHFGKASAEAIAAAVAGLLKDIVPKIVIQMHGENSKTLQGLRSALGQNEVGGNLRAGLLYWKEALYSPNRNISYRRMSADSAAYWAAHDLHEQLTPFHPHSAEFFLREALRAAVGDATAREPMPLEKFCASLGAELAPGAFWPNAAPQERLTLLDAVHGVAGEHIRAEDVPGRTGLSAAHSLVPREELAVWLLRDLQARRLVGGS